MRSAARDPGAEAEEEAVQHPQDGLRYPPPAAPYYVATGEEIAVFETCHARRLPMMLKGPVREVFPVGPQRVSVALDGRSVASAGVLVAGRELPVRTESGRAVVDVPGIETLEVVHFTWR